MYKVFKSHHSRRSILFVPILLLVVSLACQQSIKGGTVQNVNGTFTAMAQTVTAGPTGQTSPTGSIVSSVTTTATALGTATLAPSPEPDITETGYHPYYPDLCNSASYVSDVTIPDGTEINYGDSFVKTWKFYNSGTCSWNHDFRLVYVRGNRMGGKSVAIDKTIDPGDYLKVSVELEAPSTEGEYTGYWQLTNSDGDLFGDTVTVLIDAVEGETTPSKTPTITLTRTPSLSPTITLTRTPSLSPTITLTRTPTLSPTITLTRTPSLTPSITFTFTPSQTWTNTPIQAPSATPTETFTPVPNTDTPTMTDTATDTATYTATATFTYTPTCVPAPTDTSTPTPTDTGTPTVTDTDTPTPTTTSTPSCTQTPTGTLTVTVTETPTGTLTITMTETPTPTLTLTH
jgi:hypothetical protein